MNANARIVKSCAVYSVGQVIDLVLGRKAVVVEVLPFPLWSVIERKPLVSYVVEVQS